MPIIDFHNHFYPPAYLDALRAGPSAVRVDIDGDGNPRLHYPGDYNIAVPGHRDIDYREQVLVDFGVDTQVLTLTTPGTHIETASTAARLASLVNDSFAGVARSRPARFTALATLPLNDPAASVKELRRACCELGFRGAMLFGNVNGVPLSDRRFWPLYEAADDLGAVLYIHPTNPVSVEAMTDYWLMPLVGFLFDTTLAAASLVFAGVPVRFPRIRWVLCHLGGAIPYIAERLDRGFEAFAECRTNIPRPAQRLSKAVLLRHGQLHHRIPETGHCLRRSRSLAGWQRLPASDRQHPQNAREPSQPGHPASQPLRDFRRKCRESSWDQECP